VPLMQFSSASLIFCTVISLSFDPTDPTSST
jgi:hypothetical protein